MNPIQKLEDQIRHLKDTTDNEMEDVAYSKVLKLLHTFQREENNLRAALDEVRQRIEGIANIAGVAVQYGEEIDPGNLYVETTDLCMMIEEILSNTGVKENTQSGVDRVQGVLDMIATLDDLIKKSSGDYRDSLRFEKKIIERTLYMLGYNAPKGGNEG